MLFALEKIARPWLVGALYLVALAVAAAGASDENTQTLGAHANAINDFVRTRYSAEIFRLGVAIVIVAALIGAVLGLAAGLLVELRDHFLQAKRSPAGVLLQSFLVTVVLHAWFETLAMATTPALYVDAFYARGGIRRTLQVLATDGLGRAGVWLLGFLLLGLYLAGPPSAWSKWPDRIRREITGLQARAQKTTRVPFVSAWLVLGSISLVVLGAASSVPQVASAAAPIAA
ncbi:MAG: hypothetical protein ABI461_18925, partial [Polyangiaceae bacterium]